jgi:hypothetical protein
VAPSSPLEVNFGRKTMKELEFKMQSLFFPILQKKKNFCSSFVRSDAKSFQQKFSLKMLTSAFRGIQDAKVISLFTAVIYGFP